MNTPDVAAVLAAHSVEDYSEGEFGGDASLCCCCHFVAYGSDLYDAGENHRAHVAEALRPVIAAAQAEALREAADAIANDPLLRRGHNVSVVCRCLRCEVAQEAGRALRERANRIGGDAR